MSTRTLLFTDCVDFVGSACKPFPGMKKYVSTGAVDVDHINDSDTEIVDYDGKPSRANLEVMAGDVLFAKMQGTKKTLLINPVLANHIYSTGFCAVRAKEGILTERCLYHLLTSEMFLSQKDKNCSGATQKAITNAGLGKIVIHVPSVEEQNNIADQLDAVIGIITKRQQELSALDDLIKARFVEMFGDPIHPLHYDKLSDIALLERGRFSPRPRNDPKYYNGEHPFIQTGDIASCNHRLNSYKQTLNELGIRVSKKFEPGTIVIAIVGATIGATAILQREVYAPDSVIGITPYSYNNIYLETLLQFWQPELLANAPESARANINLSILGDIPIIRTELSNQEEFAVFVAQVDKSKVVVQKALDEAQLLFDSLMQQYFG